MKVSKAIILFLVAMCMLSLNTAVDLLEPVVHTKVGGLRGQYVSVKGKETGVHAYLGVPFAKPPLGPFRLAPPQPTDGWEGVRDATQQPRMCFQNKQYLVELLNTFVGLKADIPDMSEDCLYLNIYTPARAAQDAKLPVMVWIHGGGLISGSASIYDGSALTAYQDVVVVIVQYRLGLLGFLSTGDEHISGNFGLLDQVEALRWVHENIHSFGGDPNLVTIFGESAGGLSVSFLILSPLSEGLFHHAIAESGTATMKLVFTKDPLSFAQMAANASGCDITSTQMMADCMKYLDSETMLTISQDHVFRFPVSVDGHFLTKDVNELYQNHELLKIPFLTGINNDEGGWLLPNLFGHSNWTEGMDRQDAMKTLAMYFFPDPSDELTRELVADEYMGTTGDPVKNRDGFTELLGDLLFNIPVIETVNAHRDAGAPVYLYEYGYSLKAMKDKRPSFVGCDHGDEIFAVLGLCFTTTHVKLLDLCTEDEHQHSRTMMSYWGTFARTGSPNGPGLVHWPQYDKEEKYLEIGLTQVPKQHLKKGFRYTFMTQTLPEKVRMGQKKGHAEL